MIRSTDRILTTHVGSLYRSSKLLEFYRELLADEPCDEGAFREQVRIEAKEALRRQADAGIDIPSDGEMSRFSLRSYFDARLSGIELRSVERKPLRSKDRTEFSDFYARAAPHYWLATEKLMKVAVCVGAIKYNPEQARRDIANMREALAGHNFAESFFPARVPMSPAFRIANEYYRTSEELDIAYADAVREEYRLRHRPALSSSSMIPFWRKNGKSMSPRCRFPTIASG
jgi:5-methyltetrahydropteroyltriglutamate--homocysteine methyltransferase